MKEIKYLDNCGILIASEQTLLIIDGLRHEKNAFGAQSIRVREYIEKRLKRFEGNCIMAFTHTHLDHFDDSAVYKLIKDDMVDKAIIPRDDELAAQCVEEAADNPKITLLKGRTEGTVTFVINDMTLRFFETKHLKFEGYDHVLNYCIEITVGQERYLVAGDTDQERLKKILDQERHRIDGIFVTPVILGKPKWAEYLKNESIRRIFIYHLPAAEDDRFGYREFAIRQQKRYGRTLPNLNLLLNEMEVIK
ncbi:hypothetical protein LI177_03600 [bacterium 210820-DFI.6.37]|nr:hypothetical protein [bacterium 210820-DFI.6.37]